MPVESGNADTIEAQRWDAKAAEAIEAGDSRMNLFAKYHAQTIAQANTAFRYSISFAIVGFLFIATSIVWIAARPEIEITRAMAYPRSQVRESRANMEELTSELTELRKRESELSLEEGIKKRQMVGDTQLANSIITFLEYTWDSEEYGPPNAQIGPTQDLQVYERLAMFDLRGARHIEQIPVHDAANHPFLSQAARSLMMRVFAKKPPVELEIDAMEFLNFWSQILEGMDLQVHIAYMQGLLIRAGQDLFNRSANYPFSELDSVVNEIQRKEELLQFYRNDISMAYINMDDIRQKTRANEASSLSQYGTPLLGLVSGAIIEAIGALFFVQTSRTRRQLSSFFDRLRDDRRFDEGLKIISQVTDDAERSKLQHAAALAMIGGTPAPVEQQEDS